MFKDKYKKYHSCLRSQKNQFQKLLEKKNEETKKKSKVDIITNSSKLKVPMKLKLKLPILEKVYYLIDKKIRANINSESTRVFPEETTLESRVLKII